MDLEGLLAELQLGADGAGKGGSSGCAGGGPGGSARRVAPHVLAVPRSRPAKPASSTAPSDKSFGASSSGCSSGGGSTFGGGSAQAAAAPQAGPVAAPASAAGGGRHNVGRIPELDYFARNLAGPPTQAPEWWLPYGKAGDVAPGGLPDMHASPQAYLTAMQAHTALEFQAAAGSALQAAEGGDPLPAQRWWPFEKVKGSAWAALAVPGRTPPALDFSDDGDPWVKHLVHVKETDSFHVAKLAKRDEETRDDILVLLPTVEGASAGRRCHMRSLGYTGSFLLAYSSAQALRHQLHTSTLPPSACLLLELAANPRRQLGGGGGGTLQVGPLHLLPDVPVNAGQRAAVEGLGPGLSVIHGPPGTGKSTTIFHIVEGRVQPGAQVLVTATRNQAIDAVVSKLSCVEGSVLVFGREERLGPHAQRYLLKERIKRHPDVAAWLGWAQQLQALLDGGAARPMCCVLAGRQSYCATCCAIFKNCGRGANGAPPDELRKLQSLLDKLQQSNYSCVTEHILQPALNRILGGILPAVKQRVARGILETTRVYACTVDSTPRMVKEMQDSGVRVSIDTVVVDEAGCVPEMALPTLIRLSPSQLVLIGDHLQLPAYTDLHKPPPNHTRSLMQRAVQLDLPAAMLTEQYRMHPSICAAISREFYGGRLTTAPAACTLRAVAAPCRLLHVPGWERHHPGTGYSNAKEALRVLQAALQAAAELRGIGVRQPTVYIISLYNMQRDLLAKLVQCSREGRDLQAACSCQVLSVDACQGDEADAVIVSTVRTREHLSSFFRDRQRVNVALSRARHLCVVCGHRSVLALPKAQPWGRVLASYDSMA
ncbi:hypothetical protein ABPG75_002788 [Micractinium tetrahymenae]